MVSLSIPWRSENSLSTTHSPAAIHIINFNEVWLFYSDKSQKDTLCEKKLFPEMHNFSTQPLALHS